MSEGFAISSIIAGLREELSLTRERIAELESRLGACQIELVEAKSQISTQHIAPEAVGKEAKKNDSSK